MTDLQQFHKRKPSLVDAEMKSWQKILAVVGAVIFGNVVAMNTGLVGPVIAIGLMVSLWCLSYVLKEKAMDKLYLQLREMDDHKRHATMTALDPETLADIHKRMKRDRSATAGSE